MASDSIIIEWVDRGRDPKEPPDRRYPNGIDINLSAGRRPTCKTDLPYPAKRCGYYVVSCGACGLRVVVTTAGRADDPRSVVIACQREGSSQ